jgi:hypothetical protein
MSQNNPLLESVSTALQRLQTVRPLLLNIHKALLEAERVRYEEKYGVISSNGEFLRLVLEDDWFSWLRIISQFIVEVDEVLWSKDPAQWNQAAALLDKTRQIFQPDEIGTLFEERYHSAIQQNSAVAGLHAELVTLIRGDLD